MATFTVFSFGTGERSTMKKKNIISQFYEACSGEHLMLEGPGTLGREVVPNSIHATNEIIAWLKDQKSVENNINLTGFSRGAVTCIHIANGLKRHENFLDKKKDRTPDEEQLLQRLKALNIHIFGIDPVAGLMNKADRDARVIPSNVKSYVALYQMDEMRRDFKPQDMSRIILESPETTQVSLLPMYGCHSDSTKIKHQGMKSGPTLTWYALHQFFTKHGTTFKDGKIPKIVSSDMSFEQLPQEQTSKDLLKHFADYHSERTAYLKSGTTAKAFDGIPVPRKKRSFYKKLEFYVKDSDFFVNQLERELFKISYPKVFNYLFERNKNDFRFPRESGCSRDEVIAQLGELKQENPNLFSRLKSRGVSKREQVIELGNPAGKNYLESCLTLQQIYPDLVPSSVTRANQMPKLAKLEAELNRLTFKYDREKGNTSPFSPRAQSRYTEIIRAQTQYIVDKAQGDIDAKYLAILNNVEAHYLSLMRSKNESELTYMLENFLKKHGRRYEVRSDSISRNVLAEFIIASFSLLKTTVNFIGTGAYIGSTVLATIGTALQDFGHRCNQMLGTLNYNPLKYVASALAHIFEGVGFLIKNSFGLKPITQFLCDSIDDLKSALVIASNAVTVNNVPPSGDKDDDEFVPVDLPSEEETDHKLHSSEEETLGPESSSSGEESTPTHVNIGELRAILFACREKAAATNADAEETSTISSHP